MPPKPQLQFFAETPTTVRLVARSPKMREVLATVERVAGYDDVSVLLTGSTGTGKSMLARWLHEHSPRADSPFVYENAASIPEGLIESELFGCATGAHSAALRPRAGLFEAAQGGTLFLDEIGELSLVAQAKLLVAIENKTIRRVGETAARSVDVRLITATHQNLDALVQREKFRADLVQRIRGFSIAVPDLDDRREDILPIAEAVLEQFGRVHGTATPRMSLAAESVLLTRRWPTNVRELRNVVRSAAVRAHGARIEPVHLEDAAHDARAGLADGLARCEAALVARALQRHKGHVSRTAAALEISRSHLYELMRRYAISRNR